MLRTKLLRCRRTGGGKDFDWRLKRRGTRLPEGLTKTYRQLFRGNSDTLNLAQKLGIQTPWISPRG